ncbi:MAG: hypothetical protein IJW18_04480 [Lachnospiraceae bacterium]|nr:hypothetical protein [Lachnospiraceae bacterium]
MANNILGLVKKKLESPEVLRLSASDRALLEQTCKGLEEIKQQRVSELMVLSDIKDMLQNQTGISEKDIERLQEAVEVAAKESNKAIEESIQKIGEKQTVSEKDILLALSEEAYAIKKVQKRYLVVTWFCAISLLASFGTMAVLILNVLGII